MAEEATAPQQETAEASGETATETTTEQTQETAQTEQAQETQPAQEQQTAERTEETRDPPAQEPSWRDHPSLTADEKLRAQAERWDTPASILKAHNQLQGEVSNRLKVPDENSPQEDWDKFRKALGVPEETAGYEVKPPEGVEFNENDEAIINVARDIAHKHSIPTGAFQGFVEEFTKTTHQMAAQRQQEIDDFQKQSREELDKEWGSDKERNQNIVTQVINGFSDPKLQELMEAKLEGAGRLGDHPAMMRFLSQFGRMTEEGTMMLGAAPGMAENLKDQLAELEKKAPPGSEAYKDPKIQRQYQEIYEKLYGTESVVGSDMRTI